MKVCLICVEIFAWGKYGGFGRSTRYIGRALVERGVEVTAVVPRRPGQRPVESLDGIRVLAYPPSAPWRAVGLLRDCDADVYHSQEASLATYLGQRAMPGRRHVITFRDPKFTAEWLVELRHPSRSRLRTAGAWLFERNPLVARAIGSADRLLCCAPHLTDELARRFGREIEFVGSPIRIPVRYPEKSSQPNVLFVARWDRRKRPERFFELAKEFSHVRFVAVGRSQDAAWDGALRKRYGHLPNLELTGFLDQFSDDTLGTFFADAWVLVNTAAREGLPTSFLEALAHGCALLSYVDPAGVVTRYGYHVRDDDLQRGLDTLLENDTWRSRGRDGRSWATRHFEASRVIDRHLSLYEELLA